MCIWSTAAENGLHSICICWTTRPLSCPNAYRMELSIHWKDTCTLIAARVLRALWIWEFEHEFSGMWEAKEKQGMCLMHTPNRSWQYVVETYIEIVEDSWKPQIMPRKTFHLVSFPLEFVIVRFYRKCSCFIRHSIYNASAWLFEFSFTRTALRT